MWKLSASFLQLRFLSTIQGTSKVSLKPIPPQLMPNAPRTRKQILDALPAELVRKLKADLKDSQLRNVLRMHKSKIEIPMHMLNIDPLTIIPRRGAHPELSVALRKKGGRNNTGRITCRHRGGGFKRRIRLLDTTRTNHGVYRLIRLEHDPNRSSKIALMQEKGSKKCSYWLAWDGAKEGDVIDCRVRGQDEINLQLPGTTHTLADISPGNNIYNIEVKPGKGGQLCRSAGCKAVIVAKDDEFASIRLPSGKVRKISLRCHATIGTVSNPTWHLRVIGKAGRNRNLGIRPTVRGVAMNARDHPHGGGKGGRSKGSNSQSPWGKICK